MAALWPLLDLIFKCYQLTKSKHSRETEKFQTSGDNTLGLQTPLSRGGVRSQEDLAGNKNRAFVYKKAQFPLTSCFAQFGSLALSEAPKEQPLPRVSGGGNYGKSDSPATPFSKKGWMSPPRLDLSATASFSSCPQQTGGERREGHPLNFK